MLEVRCPEWDWEGVASFIWETVWIVAWRGVMSALFWTGAWAVIA